MGSGFKDFAAGDVLTANDVDGYLMRQTAMTFADASARDSALSGVLDEGMVAYLEDTDRYTFYTGSAWADVVGLGGGSAAKTFGTFASGDVLQAAELNAGLPCCVVEVASQSMPSGTTTSFAYSTEISDTYGWHSTVTNTDRITPDIAGIYLAVWSCDEITSNSNRLVLALRDATTNEIGRYDVDGSTTRGSTLAAFLSMNGTTDYVYSTMFQNTGVNLTVTNARLALVRIAG